MSTAVSLLTQPTPDRAPTGVAHFLVTGEGAEQLVADAARSLAPVTWMTPAGISGAGRLVRTATETQLVDEAQDLLDGPATVSFVHYGVPFSARLLLRRGIVTDVEPPRGLERRRNPRVPAVGVSASWWSVAEGGLCMATARVVDLSATGARLLVSPRDPGPSARGTFPMQIVAGDRTLSCMARLRSRAVRPHGIEYGVELVSRPALRPLALTCFERLLPRLTFRHRIDASAVAGLFDRSGYLALRPGTVPTAGWLGFDDTSLSWDMVHLAEPGLPTGHVSVTRAYRRTWLGHQIAMLCGRPDTVATRAALYTAFAIIPTLLDGADTHLLGYYDLSRPWHRVFFTAFVDAVGDPEVAAVVPWDRFEASGPLLDDGDPLGSDGAIEVGPPREGEMVLLTHLARSLLPSLLADALDLDPDTLVSEALHEAYEGSPFSRERRVLVLRQDGRITAVALCETTSRALSLFNIMNVAQIYAVAGAASAQGRRRLQQAVRAHYRQRGIEDPIIVAPAGTFDGAIEGAVHLEETMGCIVWSGRGLRAYENYLRLRFAWLAQGKRPSTT